MKRTIIALVLIIATLLSFGACTPDEEHVCENPCSNCGLCTNEDCTEDACKDKCECVEDLPHEETVYELLNKLVKVKYSQIDIDVSTTTGDVELTAEYSLTSDHVTYRIDQLNTLPEDGNLDNVPSSPISVFSGRAEIKDGQIISLDNESVSLPSYDQLKGAFNFDEGCFSNVNKSTKGTFKANVDSPAKFFGRSIDAKNMKVVVEYSDIALKTITITYETDNSQVKLSYEFQK